MVNKGSYLKTPCNEDEKKKGLDDHLSVGDYLVSPNGVFYAYLFEGGNLCVKYGTYPDLNFNSHDLWQSKHWDDDSHKDQFGMLYEGGNFCIERGIYPNSTKTLWCSGGSQKEPGSFILCLNDDGNLAVYQGTDPSKRGKVMWSSGKTDPVDNISIETIDYNLEDIFISNPLPKELGIYTLKNTTDNPVKDEHKIEKTITETSQWSCTISAKITVSDETKVSIPEIGEAGTTVTYEVGMSLTLDNITTRSETYSTTVYPEAQPHQQVDCVVTIADRVLVAPCIYTGKAFLKSKISVFTIFKGQYTGTSAYGVKTEYKTTSLSDVYLHTIQ